MPPDRPSQTAIQNNRFFSVGESVVQKIKIKSPPPSQAILENQNQKPTRERKNYCYDTIRYDTIRYQSIDNSRCQHKNYLGVARIV